MAAGERFEELVAIMSRLRAPDGCPWDREQTFASIKPYLLEESYEVMDAIDQEDWPGLREELGDLLLQPVFFAQLATEQGLFTIADALEAINQKLIRRHPHVFGDGSARTPDEVKKRWDEIKGEEKRARGEKPKRLLDAVPRALPALVEAQQIGSRAAGVGFDWPSVEEVEAKVEEELAEVRQARQESADRVEEELGDLLFAVVNWARHLRVDPEQALRKANAKFRRRFAYVESAAGEQLSGMDLEAMEALWVRAKQAE